ncbi:MAG TPA: hypothetical protein VHF67_07275 [Gaiellaceae bacterium]|nr:hypothetical protein [Gaiellaceae bacterium]
MTDERVRRLLRRAAPPGELDAERRAWAIIRAAYDPATAARPRAWPTRPLIALAAVLALVAAALSPPGRAVGGWVRDAIGRERVAGRPDARAALASLPAPGRLLVVSRRGTWVVSEDGSKRRLGAYADASWSPRGLHVVLVRGPRLVASTPTGEIRWTLTRRPRVLAPRWSPSGFRIAYGVRGTLRVVNGDGEPDRAVAPLAVPGSWAWAPGADRHLLAYATPGGAVRLLDVDAGRARWAVRGLEQPPRKLVWSADGKRLVALADAVVYVFDARGRLLRSQPPPLGSAQFVDTEFARRGHAFAVVARHMAGRTRVVLLDAERVPAGPRLVFNGEGRLSRVSWSPDGRWLLVTWPSADQWLFLRMPRVGEVRAIADIQREFDPGGGRTGTAPRPVGWCCAP